MNEKKSRANLVGRRAELLAELFLQDLKPAFLSRTSSVDIGYDFLIGFNNPRKGVNNIAVEVKATERSLPSRFPIDKRTYTRLAHSNLPALLLVVNVKQNEIYYAWLGALPLENNGHQVVSIPVRKIDEATKQELQRQLKSAELTNATTAVG
jgi:Domain of unknown function (DUF4365)